VKHHTLFSLQQCLGCSVSAHVIYKWPFISLPLNLAACFCWFGLPFLPTTKQLFSDILLDSIPLHHQLLFHMGNHPPFSPKGILNFINHYLMCTKHCNRRSAGWKPTVFCGSAIYLHMWRHHMVFSLKLPGRCDGVDLHCFGVIGIRSAQAVMVSLLKPAMPCTQQISSVQVCWCR